MFRTLVRSTLLRLRRSILDHRSRNRVVWCAALPEDQREPADTRTRSCCRASLVSQESPVPSRSSGRMGLDTPQILEELKPTFDCFYRNGRGCARLLVESVGRVCPTREEEPQPMFWLNAPDSDSVSVIDFESSARSAISSVSRRSRKPVHTPRRSRPLSRFAPGRSFPSPSLVRLSMVSFGHLRTLADDLGCADALRFNGKMGVFFRALRGNRLVGVSGAARSFHVTGVLLGVLQAPGSINRQLVVTVPRRV